jgi:phenylacetic acid degradation operon negative regulatory protein
MSEAAVDRLVADLHEQRLRVWSIVITYFGDAVVPRGGVAWLGALRALMARMRIESGTLGAAMSRLTADQWLVRRREGRFSFYRLDDRGRAVFETAARRIYGVSEAPPPRWSGRWRWLMWPAADAQRLARLRAAGFGSLGPRMQLRPERTDDAETEARRFEAGAIRFVGEADPSTAWPDLVAEAFSLDAVAEAYRRVNERFRPLADALSGGGSLSPVSAMAARTLLVHEFRRAVLKDPLLPPGVRPEPWAGDEARRLTGNLYRLLLPASEAWLDEGARVPFGQPMAPEPAFWRRFGGLSGPGNDVLQGVGLHTTDS